ncbi:MAG: nucleoid-associated protein [Pseudomonadales bacterium]|uniref:Nucleoid-associated protein NdpA n=1 Tax=Oleiphilus messinensis TaxID=141451 RepID=A0A1Y0I938_9GAMM|nr:nucleoid-associated protein [Oleiphilus messinensis]ARU55944.1 nucleoid-associated protein NdpA [Oleiphilus messinensis]MCG8612956.1 nucleoid-associated protein [Pseudomonadales bacterium]
MAITNALITKLTRTSEDGEIETQIREDNLPVDAELDLLFSQYKRLFNAKAGKKFGAFETDYSEYPFSRWLDEYTNEKISFASLYNQLTQHFLSILKEIPTEVYGFLLAIHETVEQGQRFYLFFLDTDYGPTITPNLSLDQTEYLSLNRLDLAIKIELDEWRNEPEKNNYIVSFISRNLSKLGDSLIQATGFRNALDIEQDTATFLDAIERFTQASDQKEASAIRQKAYNFCVEQHKQGEPVRVEQLSQEIDESNPERFEKFAEENLPEIKKELRPDHRKAKRLVRFSGKGNGINLSFSSDLIQNSIVFDSDSNTLTIKEIPKSLKQQLAQFFEEK